MISRRNFAAITMMMLVICFLFLFPQVVKETQNPYDQNRYAIPADAPQEPHVWRQPTIRTAADLEQADTYVLFIGDASGEVGYAAQAWAQYNKTLLLSFADVPEFTAFCGKLPNVAILEADSCDFVKDIRTLRQWSQSGVTLIFSGLPTAERVNASPQVRDLLGIRKMISGEVPLEAIHMYEGFLLGGERIYGRETELDRRMMDLRLTAAWPSLQPGTETYLAGMLSEELLPKQEYRNEQLPPLIWRKSQDGVNVFVVNGDFLKGNTGIGFLSAILAKNSPYLLYPVVNSQLLTVANFPSMAEENREQLAKRYGKGQIAAVRDLLWPSMESVSEHSGFRMSSFFMPQYRYLDDQEPVDALVSYYLALLREKDAEAGLSLQHDAAIALADKWEYDKAFLDQSVPSYQFCSAYLTQLELAEFRTDSDAYSSILTVSGNLEENSPLFSYLDEDTLCQAVTHDLLNFSFSKELELCSLETALGYSNAMIDMRRVIWPEEGEPGWEVYYERIASNLITYWRPFPRFDRITISESDARVRSFLCMDFAQKREGDVISVEIQSPSGGADFLLRTHMEDVAAVSGGTFERLERGAWLIHGTQPHVEITLRMEESRIY